MRILQGLQRILNAAHANQIGVALDVSNYKEITFQLATSGNTAATIKFAVSMSNTKPDFTASPSTTNVYDFVDITPLNNQASPIVGGTGIVLTGTDVKKLYAIDANFIKWLCPIISGYSAGSINCDLNAANDYSR